MRTMRFLAGVFLGGWVLLSTAAAASFPDTSPAATAPGHAPRFVLVPTSLGSASEHGVVEFGGRAGAVTELSVRVQQLPPGLYWVVMVRKSDGAAVVLGPLSAFNTSEFGPDRRAGADPNQRTSGHQVQVLQTQAVIKIPTPFDSADVAQILIEDVNGAAVLAGSPARP